MKYMIYDDPYQEAEPTRNTEADRLRDEYLKQVLSRMKPGGYYMVPLRPRRWLGAARTGEPYRIFTIIGLLLSLSGCAGTGGGPDWQRVAWAAGNMRANLRESEDRAERNQERFQDQVYREQLLIQLQNQDRY